MMGLAVATAGGRSARANEPAYVRLDYATLGDTTCPGERYFRDLLTSRMGYEPFRPEARSHVDIRIEPSKTNKMALTGRITMRAGGEGRESHRELVGQVGRCVELAQAVAVTLAVMLDPFGEHAARNPNAQPPAESGPIEPAPVAATAQDTSGQESPAPREPNAETSPKTTRESAHLEVTVAGLGSLGLLPGLGIGGLAGAAVRLGALSLGAGARWETTPGEVDIERNRVNASLIAGSGEGCFSRSILRGCVVIDLGSYAGREETVAAPTTRRTFFADAGVRAALRIPLASRTALLVFVEGRIPLTPPELVVDGRRIFEPSPITGSIGAGPSFDVF